VPIVYVTHQIDEAARLGDHLLWLDQGSLRAQGPISDLLGSLELGVRLGDEAGGIIVARVTEQDEQYHLTKLESVWGTVHAHRLPVVPGTEVRLRVRARDVSLGLGLDERSSILNVFQARVTAFAEATPGEVLVQVACLDDPSQSLLALITQKSRNDLALVVGTSVLARVKGVSVR
jgi:molybdate transport system ATP-binding protein